MDQPNYVLKANEMAWSPKPNSRMLGMMKAVVRGIIVVLIVGSVLFQDNLLSELSLSAKALLFAMICGTLFVKTREKTAKPFEIRFYDDYLVIYREKRYYSPRLSRMEFDKFLYKDIKKIQFKTVSQRINIYGIVEGTWYNYNKNGTLPVKPSYHKTTDSISYFYTSAAPNVDFVAEIEAHTPIKVIVADI